VPVGAWLDGFVDVSHAYRFGPPPCDVVVATLIAGAAPVAEAFYFPAGLAFPREADLGLAAEMSPATDGTAELVVRTRRFAQAVTIDVPGMTADDDFFHLAPGGERRVRLRRTRPEGGRTALGQVSALNAARPVAIRAPA